MKPYLVSGKIRQTQYMGHEFTFDDMRIVMANSKIEAIDKFEIFWDAKSESYGDCYYAHSIKAEEPIE